MIKFATLVVVLLVLGFLYVQGPETKKVCESVPSGSFADRTGSGYIDGLNCDVRVRTNAWDKIYGAVAG